MKNAEGGAGAGARDAADRARIVPTLEVAIEPGVDLVWCATLDLAWRELGALLGGGVAIGGAAGSPAAQIARALDASPVRPDAVDPGACVALAGLHTEAWVRRAEEEIRARLGDTADARLLDREPRPELFVAYALLSKAWTFRTPLIRGHGRMRVGSSLVESFGLWENGSPIALHEARAEQVLVHHHRFGSDDEPEDWPSEDFLVELVTEDPCDRIFVARCPPQPTLAATVRWGMEKVRDDVAGDPAARLTHEERFEAPCVDFDRTRRYDELYGATIENPGFEGRAIGEVLERVRFRLDEGGARLVSEARIGGLSLPPRNMVANAPFLVMLARRGAAVPFLALWIETDELLIRREQ